MDNRQFRAGVQQKQQDPRKQQREYHHQISDDDSLERADLGNDSDDV